MVDVLVIGGGNAALCAALMAREAGASVLLLEAAPREWRGGNSQHTRNLRCMHDAPQDVLVDAYPEEEYWQDLLKVTGGLTNEHLARLVIRESSTCRDWMRRHGVNFQPPLSGALLEMDGMLGFKGWQWLFVLEAVPAVLLGFVVLGFLTDRPEQAKWLADDERAWLVKTMKAENDGKAATASHSIWRGLADPRVLALALVNILFAVFTGNAPLTNGGPLNSTYTALMYVYSKAFQGFNFDYGLASAAGLVVAAVALLLSILNFRFFRDAGAHG